jgi:hypothetical protein
MQTKLGKKNLKGRDHSKDLGTDGLDSSGSG